MTAEEDEHATHHTKPHPIDLALVIIPTLACILFVLTPWLNESPVRVVPVSAARALPAGVLADRCIVSETGRS